MFRVNKFTLYMIITAIFMGGILSGCFLDNLRSYQEPGDSRHRMVEIDPAHQNCALDSECGLVYVDCSTCDCGVPINLMYEEHYQGRYEELCRDYIGPVCELYCPPYILLCNAGRCEIKLEE